MAISNAITLSTAAHIINSEKINEKVIQAHEQPRVADVVAWHKDCSQNKSNVLTFPKANAVAGTYSEASGYTETDTVPVSAQGWTQTQITAVTVPIRQVVSDEARQDSIIDQIAQMVLSNLSTLRTQRDTDFLSNFTSGTQTGGIFTGLALTTSRYGAALFKARELSFTEGTTMVSVLAHTQVRDLADSVRTTTAALFSSAHGENAANVLLDNTKSGYLGKYEGVHTFGTGLVPEYNSTNHCGAIFAGGEGGALVMAEWVQLENEPYRDAITKSLGIVSSGRYGTGLVNQENLVRVASSKT